MKTSEKLRSLFAPLDYVVATKKYEYMWPKQEEVDIPPELLSDARRYLTVGEYWDRNPTCWYIFQGQPVDPDSDEWNAGISNFYRLVSKPDVTELDNERNYIALEVNFEILVVNAKELPESTFEEIKCAIVKTSFGDFPLVQDNSESIS